MASFVENIKDAFSASFRVKGVYFLYLLSFLYVFPILLSDVYYMDDYDRVIYGYGWSQDGRFFANAIMWLLNLNFASIRIKQVDLFPYTTIISSLILVFSGILICDSMKILRKNCFSIAPLFIMISPFMLENLTYRYDSLIMSVSVFLVVFPFIFIEDRKLFFLTSVISLMLAWMTYQSTVAGYVSLCAIFATKFVLERNFIKSVSILTYGMAAFVGSTLFYEIILKLFHVQISFGRSVSIFQEPEVFKNFLFNIKNGLIFIRYNIDFRFFMSALPLFCMFLFSAYKYISVEKIKLASVFSIFFLVFSIFLCGLGLNVFIFYPPWWLRILIAFPFVFLLLIFVAQKYVCYEYINIAVACIALYSFSLCATYASALKEQNEFTNQILALANPYLVSNDHTKVVIDGEIPYAPQVEYSRSIYKIIGTLVDKYIRDGWYWGERRIGMYGFVDEVFIEGAERNDILAEKCSYNVLTRNKFFVLRVRDKMAIVDFTKAACK